MQHGKALIFSAPSGSGKTTIVRHLLGYRPDLTFSISATTRRPREGEQHGRDYYFLDKNEFETKIGQGAFVEYEEVYSGMYYGTLQEEVDRVWQEGNHVVFDVDVVGGLNIKERLGDRALAIFVKAPDFETIRARLKARGSEPEEQLKIRLDKIRQEMAYEPKFDRVIVNDRLEDSFLQAEQLVDQFLG